MVARAHGPAIARRRDAWGRGPLDLAPSVMKLRMHLLNLKSRLSMSARFFVSCSGSHRLFCLGLLLQLYTVAATAATCI